MKKQKIWMAIVAFENDVSFSKGCSSQRKAEKAIVEHLCKEEGFDGKDFNDACFWIGEKDLRLDLMVFEMEQADFDTCGYTIEPPPKEKTAGRPNTSQSAVKIAGKSYLPAPFRKVSMV